MSVREWRNQNTNVLLVVKENDTALKNSSADSYVTIHLPCEHTWTTPRIIQQKQKQARGRTASSVITPNCKQPNCLSTGEDSDKVLGYSLHDGMLLSNEKD